MRTITEDELCHSVVTAAFRTNEPVRFVCDKKHRRWLMDLAQQVPGCGISTYGIGHPEECTIHRLPCNDLSKERTEEAEVF